MKTKTTPGRAIHEDECFSEKVVAWCADKYPTVDVAETFDVFADHCRAVGSMYADWDAALRQWIRNGVDKGYGGVKFKQGIKADPKWMPVLAKAKQYEFRAPELPRETPTAYNLALEKHIDELKTRNTVTPMRFASRG